MCLCVCERFIIIMFLTTLCLQLMSCVQVFVPPLLWTLRRIQTNRLDLTEQYEFRQNVISSQVFCLTSADNKKPPPMSTVHTHTGWDWPSGHSRHQAVSGAGQETSDNHRLPRCSFVQQSSKWQDRTFNAVHPAFYRPQWVTGELTHTKILAVAIKHFQPGAWEGARVWETQERAVNCEPRWLLTWLHFSNCSRVLSSCSLFLWPLSHCYKWAGRGRGRARPTQWSSGDLEMGITRD